jgi:imidazolonepropionase-like amidohydrolase
MHVHLAEDEARAGALDTLLAYGVTTARDMGGPFDVLERWRRDLASEHGNRTYDCIAARNGAITPNLVAYVHAGRIAGPESAELTRRLVDRLGDVVVQMSAAGVVIMTASDAPGEHNEIPWGASVHEEMALLVSAGLQPLRAIIAATAAPARFTGRYDDVGSIEAGKQADLLLLRSCPLDDIAATRDIRWILSNGRLIRPDGSASAPGTPETNR